LFGFIGIQDHYAVFACDIATTVGLKFIRAACACLCSLLKCLSTIFAQSVPLEPCLGDLATILVTRRRIKLPKPREAWRGQLAQLQFIVPSPMSGLDGVTQEGKPSKHALSNTGPRRFLAAFGPKRNVIRLTRNR
jgi:hypothetical protein